MGINMSAGSWVYYGDRSPTGHAIASGSTLEQVPIGEPAWATKAEAIAYALRRWVCNK